MTKKYKDVDTEAAACVHNLQYSSVQFSTVIYLLTYLLFTLLCKQTHVFVYVHEVNVIVFGFLSG